METEPLETRGASTTISRPVPLFSRLSRRHYIAAFFLDVIRGYRNEPSRILGQ